MNLKKAKALRKSLKSMPTYSAASVALISNYIRSNVRNIPVPNTTNFITTSTLRAPSNSKRGIYLLQKKKV